MKIAHSRALVDSALNGTLNANVFEKDAFFGLDIPTSCNGVPGEVLNPRNTWADKKKYDETATRLVKMFKDNFRKYAPNVTADVTNVMSMKLRGACLQERKNDAMVGRIS